jgi:hypothetical protein
LENWGDFGNYNSDRTQMEEEWKKEAGLLWQTKKLLKKF